MTMQIKDTYKFNGDNYVAIVASKSLKFSPRKFGLHPYSVQTNCWAGYWCGFDISENGFFLEDLFVHDANNNYPPINGVDISPDSAESSHKHYEHLHIPIKYTGRILICRNFLYDEYPSYRAFPHVWLYEDIFELIFWRGKLIKKINHNEVAKQMRATNLNENYKEFVKKFPKRKFWWIQKWKF